ncbi:MAG: ribose-phosphate pyrophosphokinase [Gemmatimonadetes bacterium]|nr:ribose-phosphate pyrophosphokinase [Gemmatimonadota bacterium]
MLVTRDMKLLSGSANRPLAREMAEYLEIELCEVETRKFADGEIFVRINENIRGADCYILQPTNPPADNLMELLLLIDAARRASPFKVTAVIPYFGYARADRKDQPRVSIAGKLVANLITAAGADRVMTIDLHSHQIQGFFDLPLDHLYGSILFLEYYRRKRLGGNLVIVGPDVGSAKMVRGFARRLDASIALVDKRRPAPNEAEVMNLIGDVRGKTAIVVDDMIDTGGTFAQTAHTLVEQGAERVLGCATHALLSDRACERLDASPYEEVAVLNTVWVPEARRFEKLVVLSVAPLLAQAVQNNHEYRSVSALFPQ